MPQEQLKFEKTFLPHIQGVSGDDSLIYRERIQSLWSGLGSITRLYSHKNCSSVIAKAIQLPDKFVHPRGWGSDVSLQRKVKSYQIESAFYQAFSHELPNQCRAPKLIAYQDANPQFLLMEDLNAGGLAPKSLPPSSTQVKQMLSWLAHFHAYMLDKSPNSLWSIGSYWHLETRREEFSSMQNLEVKGSAQHIHETLHKAKFKTVIHGDAKLANFCFSEQRDIAAVDFQYVGKGVGVIDVMYLFTSLFDDNELFDKADMLLEEYFELLTSALRFYQQDIDVQALIKEWRSLYAIAWADFYRFLLGWSPEHFKVNNYMKTQYKNTKCSLGLT